MARPLLSIAIPTYNRADLLDLCLGRIITQLGSANPAVELLVSNNASTDNTKQIVEKHQQIFGQLRYFENEKNGGPDFNIAKCFELATAKYVWVFSDDDIVLPRALEYILLLLAQNDLGVLFLVANFYYHSVHEFPVPDEPLVYKIYDTATEIIADRHFWLTYISGVITNKDLVKEESTLYQYQNSNLIQLGWVLPALLKGKPSLKVTTPLILGRSLTTLDFKLFQVYGTSYPKVLNGLAEQGAIPWEIRNLLVKLIIEYYFRFYITPDAVYTHGERPFRILFNAYWREPNFWTTMVPLFINRSTAKLTRKVKHPARRTAKKLLASVYGKLASLHQSVQTDKLVSSLKGLGARSILPTTFHIKNPQCVEIGRAFQAQSPFTIVARTSYQGTTFTPVVTIGHHVQFGADCRLDCTTELQIGDWVTFGNRVSIMDNELDESPAVLLTSPPANRRLVTRGIVVIADNVLVEDDVRIKSGISIGENTIVRAGAVVSESVPPNVIVAGNPAKIVGQFDLIN